MKVLLLHEGLQADGGDFLRSRHFVEDLESRGHTVRLASFITNSKKDQWEAQLSNDLITTKEVIDFEPDALLIELGAFSCGPRIPGRNFLNFLKEIGCIVVHCGLPTDEYRTKQEEYDPMFSGFGCGIHKPKAGSDEFPTIRGADGQSHTARTDAQVLRSHCDIDDPNIFQDVPWVETRGAPLVISPSQKILLTAGPSSRVKAYGLNIHGDANAIYGSYRDWNGIEILITGHFITDTREKITNQNNRTFLLNVLEHFHHFHHFKYRFRSKDATTPRIIKIILSYAWSDNEPDAQGVGKIDAIVQALRDRQILVDRDTEIFRAGYMPISEWEARLPEVDKAVFIYSKNWRNRPAPNKELEAAEREADRRFNIARLSGQESEPFILFFCLDDTSLPQRHQSHLYRKLSGQDFGAAVELMYRDIVGLRRSAMSYDISRYEDFVF